MHLYNIQCMHCEISINQLCSLETKDSAPRVSSLSLGHGLEKSCGLNSTCELNSTSGHNPTCGLHSKCVLCLGLEIGGFNFVDWSRVSVSVPILASSLFEKSRQRIMLLITIMTHSS